MRLFYGFAVVISVLITLGSLLLMCVSVILTEMGIWRF